MEFSYIHYNPGPVYLINARLGQRATIPHDRESWWSEYEIGNALLSASRRIAASISDLKLSLRSPDLLSFLKERSNRRVLTTLYIQKL